MSASPTDLISVSEAAALCPSPIQAGKAIHKSTVRDWIRRGELRGFKRGHFWFVSKGELLALYQQWERQPDLTKPKRPRVPATRPEPAWVEEVLSRRNRRRRSEAPS